LKEPGLLREMADFRTRARKEQDDLGTSCWAKTARKCSQNDMKWPKEIYKRTWKYHLVLTWQTDKPYIYIHAHIHPTSLFVHQLMDVWALSIVWVIDNGVDIWVHVPL